jgi:hypothetical protein
MIPILADVVWPALYIMARSYTWWGIALGLVIEYFVLRLLSRATWQKTLIVVLAANAVTSVIGYFAMPLLTFGWEFVLESTVYQVIKLGTFNPFGWLATVVVMGAITAFPEYIFIKKIMNVEFTRKKPWLWWWLANCASVFVAFVTVVIWPVQL